MSTLRRLIGSGSLALALAGAPACTGAATEDAPENPAAVESAVTSAPALDVPWIAQNPQLPRGCEVTSLAMMLRHAGVAADKMTLAAQVRKVPYFANGLNGNPYDGFVGNMYDFAQSGYGVYHGPIKALAEQYLPHRVVDLTGASFDDVLTHVAQRRAVWIITNATFGPLGAGQFQTWHTPSGPVQITWHEHSVVITGFDASTVSINDPLGGKNKRLARAAFRGAWEQMGRQAITYLPTGSGAPPPPPPPGGDCGVHGDGRLYCTNKGGSAMYAAPRASSAMVNHLRSTHSWFECWATGDAHAGGNTTWYRTQGDDNPSHGWVPAVDLSTSMAFDANPSALGLARCGP